MNAFSIGIGASVILAIGVMWLEKRSGLTLEREQYRSLMGIIFLVITLSSYVILEFLQQREEERRSRATKAKRPRQKRNGTETFEPIFGGSAASLLPSAATRPGLGSGLGPNGEPLPPPPIAEAVAASAADATPFAATPAPAAPSPTASAPVAPPIDTATPALFTQGVSAAVATLDEEPSPFVQFGLHLYVMGACGEAVRRGALPFAAGKSLLIRMLKDVAVSQRGAAALAANANTFSQVPNFRGPIDAGYRAMAHLYDVGFVDVSDLPEVLAQWRMQELICKPPESVTFVATSMIAQPPDAPAEDRQLVMRAHNKGMAAAMARFQGREVHNLGNGMIAAFTDAARAVRAAEGCQEYLDQFAAENQKLYVAPRIGIDTEVAAMVNDKYVSVAMTRAVTIATLTPSHNIYCSEATCEDAETVVAFEPVPDMENSGDLPKLFIAAWSRMPARGGPALEYRQVGTMVDINPALSSSK